MKSIFALIVRQLCWLVLLCISSSPTNATVKQVELQTVSVVLRHGDRTPTNFYPNDPFKDPKYWTEGIGQLNKVGVDRLEAAARLYANKYGEFLSKTKGWPVDALTSPSGRCINSCQYFSLLLLNETHGGVNDFDIRVSDRMLSTGTPCPNADLAWRKQIASKPVQDYIASKRKIIEYLEQKTGDSYLTNSTMTLRKLEFLATTLEIERDEYGLDVPEWAKEKKTIEELSDLKQHAYLFDWQPAIIQRLRGGLLLNDIGDKMAFFGQWLNNQSTIVGKPRMFIYVTHDVNQVTLFQALNLYSKIGNKPTSYASALVFELYTVANSTSMVNGNDTQMQLVRIIYRQVVRDHKAEKTFHLNDTVLLMDQCAQTSQWYQVDSEQEQLCTLEQFWNAIEDKFPENWPKECGLSNNFADLFNLKWSLVYTLISFSISLVFAKKYMKLQSIM